LGVLVEKAISHGQSMVSRAQGFREYGELMQRVSHLLIKQTWQKKSIEVLQFVLASASIVTKYQKDILQAASSSFSRLQ